MNRVKESDFPDELPDISFSYGFVQTGPEVYDSDDKILRRADEKMYEHKSTKQSLMP